MSSNQMGRRPSTRWAVRALVIGAAVIALAGAPAHSHDSSGEPVGVGAAHVIYDNFTDGAGSAIAGPTKYLISGDVTGNGRADFVHATQFGLQVFHNVGQEDALPEFELVQEIPLGFSCGGCFTHWNDDGFLDIVLASDDDVFVAINDGTGQFDLELLFSHGFGVTTIAKSFDLWSPPDRTHPDGTHTRCIVVAPASEYVEGDLLGENPGNSPFPYVVEWLGFPEEPTTDGPSTAEHSPLGAITQLPLSNTHNVHLQRVDDAMVNVLLSDRSPFAILPFQFHRVALEEHTKTVADQTTRLFSQTDLSGLFFPFGFSVDTSEEGLIGWGNWHRSSLIDLNDPPLGVLDIPIEPVDGGPDAREVFGFQFADMNCDGSDDVVMLGLDTGLVIRSLHGDPLDPANSFAGSDLPGLTTDFVIDEFNVDALFAPDVVVGGDLGLFYLGNVKDGPPEPPPVPPHMLLLDAIQCLSDVLDPLGSPALENPVARGFLVSAYAVLLNIPPSYLADGTVAPPELRRLNFLFGQLRLTIRLLNAGRGAFDPQDETDFGAKIDEIEQALLDAADGVATQIVGLGGLDPRAPKRASASKAERRAERLRAKALSRLEDSDALQTAANRTGNLRQRGKLRIKAIRKSHQAARLAEKALRTLRKAGLID